MLLPAAAGVVIFFLLYLHYRSRYLLLKGSSKALIRNQQQQEEATLLLNRQLTELKLVNLKPQVNPHFQFNCPNGIYTTLMMGETALAQEYIARFAGLPRKVLMPADKNLIPLQEETDMPELYLKLEQLRTNNGFEYTLFTDPGSLQRSCMYCWYSYLWKMRSGMA